MVTIEVLGHGCANCQKLEANAREAVAMAGIEADVVKVTDDAADRGAGCVDHPRPGHRRRGQVLRPHPGRGRHRGVAERGLTPRADGVVDATDKERPPG